MKKTEFSLEFVESVEGTTIFILSVPQADLILLSLHQPSNEVFFKIKGHIFKFIVSNKPRKIFYTLDDRILIKCVVQIPLKRPDDDETDYSNIPEWWKDMEII